MKIPFLSKSEPGEPSGLKTKLVIVVVYSVTVFAVGRYMAPTKVVTEVKTVEVVKTKEVSATDKKKKSKKKIVIVENTSPDGKKEKTTTITDDTVTTDKSKEVSTSDSSKSTESRKEVTRDTSKVTLSFLAGAQFTTGDGLPLVYGGSITKPILGPITLGVWGLTNATGGFSLGLTF